MRILTRDLSIDRLFPSGAWRISAILDGQWVCRRYFDYSKRGAIAAFRAEFTA